MNRSITLAALLAAVAMPLMLVSAPARAAECSATVESTDAMKYTTSSLTVPAACRTFTVTLKHTGKLPVNVMGHNFVLGSSTDIGGIVADGMKAGAGNQYVKPGDARVIAASELIGGGQSTTVKIPVSQLKAGRTYNYVCTFPGHSALMKGTLKLGS
jgi:azurin